MITKLIAAVVVIAFLYGGWNLFLYWENVRNEKESVRKEAAAAAVTGDTLEGLPYGLDQSLRSAQSQGAAGLKNWLKTYAPNAAPTPTAIPEGGLPPLYPNP